MSVKTPVISIIGRPNVGKSSVFNRLMRSQHRAITHDMPGVTRDRHYGLYQWEGNKVTSDVIFVDTGGFYPKELVKDEKEMAKEDIFFRNMESHALTAIRESDFILFVVDGREGVLPTDEVIADILKKEGKPFVLIVNKLDTSKQDGEELAFYALGIDEEQMFTVSAAHGRGFEDLRDLVDDVILLTQEQEESYADSLQRAIAPKSEVVARVCLIGAPNAGKSTTLNRLLGVERALVTNIAGTTVDPIDGYFDLDFGADAAKLKPRRANTMNDKLLVAEYDRLKEAHPDLFKDIQIKAFEEDEQDDILEDMANVEESFAGEEELSAEWTDWASGGEGELASKDDNDEEEEALPESTIRSIHLIDTAGIRKQSHIKEFVESQSVFRALRCITESDIVIYLVDAEKGISHQDRRLLDIAYEKGKSVIIGLNKFDLLSEKVRDTKARQEWLEDIRYTIPWLDFCQLIPFSAKYGNGIKKLRKVLKETILIREQKVPTSELNYVIQEIIDRHPIVVQKAAGTRFKVKYASFVKSDPPTFLLFSNRSRGIPANYQKYIKNNLRAYFGYRNTPVHLIFRSGYDLEQKAKISNKRANR
jgi:GTP-binding protein